MRSRGTTYLLMVCLLFVIVSIGIGYAYMRDSLTLNGSSGLASNSFDVHFENIVVNKETAKVNTAANIYNDSKSVGFNVTLTKPSDTYDFNVDVVNAGSIDAMVGIVPTINIPDEYKNIIEYKISYVDGISLKENDLLKAANNDIDRNNKVNVETLHIVLSYRSDVTNDQLVTTNMPSFNVNFEIPYVQANEANVIERNSLYQVLASNAVSDAIASEFVTSETGIDYTYQSSDTNGKGLYKYRESTSEEYPIYYYRGEVYNNNVLFANYCWKIVRTTETGGIKLIYNGTPSNGVCNNANGDDVLETTVFNDFDYYSSSGDFHTFNAVGYVMGNNVKTRDINKRNNEIEGIVFGNDVSYENGHYKLSNTYVANSTDFYTDGINKVGEKHHYTCFSTGSECEDVYYIYYYNFFYMDSTHAYVDFKSIYLEDGLTLSETLDEASGFTARYDSKAKKQVDDFYKNHLINYEDNLEDAIWCLDNRYETDIFNKDVSINGAKQFPLYNYRHSQSHIPDITCQIKDSFTTNIANGNGKFEYMTGTITVDELMLAGYNKSTTGFLIESTNNFLTASRGYWTLSLQINTGVSIYYVRNDGYVGSGSRYYTSYGGTRPMISLRNDILYTEGDGTQEHPYVIAER